MDDRTEGYHFFADGTWRMTGPLKTIDGFGTWGAGRYDLSRGILRWGAGKDAGSTARQIRWTENLVVIGDKRRPRRMGASVAGPPRAFREAPARAPHARGALLRLPRSRHPPDPLLAGLGRDGVRLRLRPRVRVERPGEVRRRVHGHVVRRALQHEGGHVARPTPAPFLMSALTWRRWLPSPSGNALPRSGCPLMVPCTGTRPFAPSCALASLGRVAKVHPLPSIGAHTWAWNVMRVTRAPRAARAKTLRAPRRDHGSLRERGGWADGGIRLPEGVAPGPTSASGRIRCAGPSVPRGGRPAVGRERLPSFLRSLGGLPARRAPGLAKASWRPRPLPASWLLDGWPW